MPHLTSSDGALVLLTLAGDPTAYDELVRRHEKRVRSAAYSVIHNPHIAEDAAQDAFLAAWLKLDRLIDPEKFGAWAARIAKNCAKNMALRFRNYLSLDDVDGLEYIRSDEDDPEQLLITEEEARLLWRGLRKLPERAQQVVYLHYYEDMNAEDIARLIGVSVGTVKSQLHDGRRKMRKELCSMDEKLNDTLLQKIRKKIDEVKNWQYKNSKAGFEKVYGSVLKDIDTMPECREKYHALADVLIRGYWWLPGEKNDKLLERIKEATRLGKNNDVMVTVLSRESFKYWGDDRLNHIKNVQIPSLDPVDFRVTIARLWTNYGGSAEITELKTAMEGFDNALKLLTPADGVYYYSAIEGKKCFEEASAEEFVKDRGNRMYLSIVREMQLSDCPKISEGGSYAYGELYSYNWKPNYMLDNLAPCDGMMRADIKPGESVTASDGSTLTFEADCETVTVPAGKFIGCEVWTSRLKTITFRNWLKSGVGLIKRETVSEGTRETRVLKSYDIKRGEGYLPLGKGNFWEYDIVADPEAYVSPTKIEVLSCDGEKAVVALNARSVRKKYDENSWLDMILKTRADYITRENPDNCTVQDVRKYAKRAIELAKTPYEKAHAETAYSVVKRIIETDQEINPDCEAIGLWNFFIRSEAYNADGRIVADDRSGRFSFEWKGWERSPLFDRLLSNHLYWILRDVTECLFDEQWKPGYTAEKTIDYYNDVLKTKISCFDAGTVEVKAGSFENCLSVDTVCEEFPTLKDPQPIPTLTLQNCILSFMCNYI